MPHALTPAFGARFELLRQRIDDSSVVYAVTIYTPTATQNATLQIGRQDGDCKFCASSLGTQSTPDADLPPWIHKHLLALARQLFRDAQRDGQWLRRLLRWHEDPHVVERRGQRASKPDAPSPAEA